MQQADFIRAATLLFAAQADKRLSHLDSTILGLMLSRPGIALRDLAEIGGQSMESIARRIGGLADLGYWSGEIPDPPKRRRRTISLALREKVYRRDGFACVYCGSTKRLTLDHVDAHGLGGETTEANLVTACLSCNSSKGMRPSPKGRGA